MCVVCWGGGGGVASPSPTTEMIVLEQLRRGTPLPPPTTRSLQHWTRWEGGGVGGLNRVYLEAGTRVLL